MSKLNFDFIYLQHANKLSTVHDLSANRVFYIWILFHSLLLSVTQASWTPLGLPVR